MALRGDLAGVALVASVASLGTPLERPVLVLRHPVPVAVVRLPLVGRPARGSTSHADVSYGLYLLAFPVQQTIVQVWGDDTARRRPWSR